jgi:hypothetical protein
MITLFLALQAAPLAEMKSSMQPVSLDESVGLFSRICFETMPDSKAAMEVINSPDLELIKLPETPTQAMQPGDAWASSKLAVTYVDAQWLPMDFGSPQCSVTVVLEGEPLHSAIATTMQTKLQLPTVKFGKEAESTRTMWDVPQTSGDKWRLFLTSNKTPSGTQMSATIMNLRGKKKK